RIYAEPHSQSPATLASRGLAIGKASPPTDCTRKPNLTERLYEEEKRRTNALLIQVFQQTARVCAHKSTTLIDVRLAPQAAHKRTFPNRRLVPKTRHRSKDRNEPEFAARGCAMPSLREFAAFIF